jgi:bacterioferritin (cytochrome b1)
MIDEGPLGNYLQDHYAGSAAGIELFRRAAAQQTDPVTRTALTAMVEDVENEREVLQRFLESINARPDPLKNASAWLAEKLGRLKPNGELLHRSALSDVVELEALRLAVEGKAAGWRVLRRLSEIEDRFSSAELDRLLASAEQQIDRLEELRLAAAERVFRHAA